MSIWKSIGINPSLPLHGGVINNGLEDVVVPALRPTTTEFLRDIKSLRDMRNSCSRDQYRDKQGFEHHFCINIGVTPLVMTQSYLEGERILTPLVAKENWHPNFDATTTIYDRVINIIFHSPDVPNNSRFVLYTPRVTLPGSRLGATAMLSKSFTASLEDRIEKPTFDLRVVETGHTVTVDGAIPETYI